MNGIASPLRENVYPPSAPQAPQATFTPARYPVAHPYGAGGIYSGPASAPERRTGRNIRIAFFAALLFVALSYNGAYRLVDAVYAAFTSQAQQIFGETGCPTLKGVLVHAVVFFFGILYLL
jgi:hypothetical protein